MKFGYVCAIETLDYIMYGSKDNGSIVITEDACISNYALTYAFGHACAESDFPVSYYSEKVAYSKDFKNLPFYITPAIALNNIRTKKKIVNTIPEKPHGKDETDYYSNRYPKKFPSYKEYLMIAPESKYVFSIFSEKKLHIPRFIKLGMFKGSVEVKVLFETTLEKVSKDIFVSAPVHINDIPVKNLLSIGRYIRLGKKHGVAINSEINDEHYKMIGDISKITGLKLPCKLNSLPCSVKYVYNDNFT